MRNLFKSWIGLAVLTLVLASASMAQPAPAKVPDSAMPRTQDGKPDFSGVWNKEIHTLQDVYGPLPFTEAGKAAQARVYEVFDPDSFCIIPGVPRVDNGPYPMEIAQRPDRIIFLYEFNHNFRVIPTDGRDHAKSMNPSFLGDSVGHWEGDTLVVDVIGFKSVDIPNYQGETYLDEHGNPHTNDMHLIQRYRLLNRDTLEYSFTIDDPKYYTKTWGAKWTIPRAPADWALGEFACTEGMHRDKLGKGPPR